MHDLRLALRSLARSPGFTSVAILTLALGIGLSTSSFSVTNAMLLRTLTLLSAITLVACYLPARRAARIDPVVALRTE